MVEVHCFTRFHVRQTAASTPGDFAHIDIARYNDRSALRLFQLAMVLIDGNVLRGSNSVDKIHPHHLLDSSDGEPSSSACGGFEISCSTRATEYGGGNNYGGGNIHQRDADLYFRRHRTQSRTTSGHGCDCTLRCHSGVVRDYT